MKVCCGCGSLLPPTYEVCPKPECKSTKFESHRQRGERIKDQNSMIEDDKLLMAVSGDNNFDIESVQ